MGNCWSRRNTGGHSGNLRNITVAVLGLDDAGKTVTAKVLKGDPPNEVVPTIGFTNIQFNFKKRQISMYDLGGGPRIRDIWRNYFGEVHGLIYVVDSSHRERIEECRDVLVGILDDMKVKGKPLLVLGNKQDMRGAMDTSEICDCLKLDALANAHQSPCRIECCSALKQEKGKMDVAISSGFQWLLDMIDSQWVTLKARVDKDVADQKEEELKERLERVERVRKLREEREKESEKNAENDELKDVNEEIKGDPFKPIDKIQFSRKVDTSSIKTPEVESTAERAMSHTSQSDLLNVENIPSILTSDAAESVQPTCNLEPGHAGNGVNGRTVEPLSSSPVEAINLEQRNPIAVAGNVLPPIEMPAEQHGEKKKRKRRNKRNRVTPLATNAVADGKLESTDSSTFRAQCLDSRDTSTEHLSQASVSADIGCLADTAIDADTSKVTSRLSSVEPSTSRDGSTDLSTTVNHSTSQTTIFARPNGDAEDIMS